MTITYLLGICCTLARLVRLSCLARLVPDVEALGEVLGHCLEIGIVVIIGNILEKQS